MSRLRQSVVLTVLAAMLGLVAAQSASAQVSDAAALAAIRAVTTDYDQIVENIPSHDGTRAAVLARHAPDEWEQTVLDLWLVERSTAIKLTDQWWGRGWGPIVQGVTWSADDRWVLALTAINTIYHGGRLGELWNTAAPSEPIVVGDGVGGHFSADGRYAIFKLTTNLGGPFVGDAAVDLASGLPLRARWGVAYGPTFTYAPECARSQEPDWKPAISTGNWLEDALAGPDPGCRFGANENEPGPPTPTPIPTPTSTPSPSPSPTPSPTPSPIAAGSRSNVPLATKPAQLPPVEITSVVKSLGAARSSGLRLRLATRTDVSLKAYVIVAGRAASSYRAHAGANATLTIGRATLNAAAGDTPLVTIPLTSTARRARRKAKQLDVTIRISASTSAGPLATIERAVRLAAR